MSKFSKILNKQNKISQHNELSTDQTDAQEITLTPIQRRTANVAYNGVSLKRVDVDLIDHSPYQPRFMSATSQDALQELAENIRNHGQINPILVRPKKGRYELIGGERRLYAIKNILKLKDIDCLIKDIGDEKAAVTALVDNINRADLSDYEIACSIQMNCQNFGYPIDQSEFISEKFNISRNKYYRLISLFDLPDFVHQDLTRYPKILSGSAASLLKTALNKSTDLVGREPALNALAKQWVKYVEDYQKTSKISTQFIKDFELAVRTYFERMQVSVEKQKMLGDQVAKLLHTYTGAGTEKQTTEVKVVENQAIKDPTPDTQLTIINQRGKKIGSLKCSESLKGKTIVSIRLSVDKFDETKMNQLKDYLQQLEQE